MHAIKFVMRVVLVGWFVGLGITFVAMLLSGSRATEPPEPPRAVPTVQADPIDPRHLDAFREQVRAFNQIAHECTLLHDYFGDIDRFPPVAIPNYQEWNQRVSRAIDLDYYERRHKQVESELCQRFEMTPDELTSIYFRGIQDNWNKPHNDAFDHQGAQRNAEHFLKTFEP